MHVCPKVACLSVPSVVAVVVTRRGSELSLSHSNCSLASRPPSPSPNSHGGKIGRLRCKFGKNVFNFALIAAAAACSGPGDGWHTRCSARTRSSSSGVLMLVMCGGILVRSCEKLQVAGKYLSPEQIQSLGRAASLAAELPPAVSPRRSEHSDWWRQRPRPVIGAEQTDHQQTAAGWRVSRV